jgi:mono/diheme cytochrome c family protein
MNCKNWTFFSFLIIFLVSVPSILQAQQNREGNHCAVSKSPYRLSMDSGKVGYMRQCVSCHQADGMGVVNSNPPLSGIVVTGDKKKLIEILVGTHASPEEKSGNKPSYVMPPNPEMEDQEIADVLTYIRNSFGNKASAVKPAEVKAERSKMKSVE